MGSAKLASQRLRSVSAFHSLCRPASPHGQPVWSPTRGQVLLVRDQPEIKDTVSAHPCTLCCSLSARSHFPFTACWCSSGCGIRAAGLSLSCLFAAGLHRHEHQPWRRSPACREWRSSCSSCATLLSAPPHRMG